MPRRQSLPAAAAITVVAAASALLLLLAAPAQAAFRHFDGTVLGKDTNARTFRISTERGERRFQVNPGTHFERVHGLEGLHRGMRIEVDAVTTRNGLLAREVELRGGKGGDVEDNGHGEDEGGGGEPEEGPTGSARPARRGVRGGSAAPAHPRSATDSPGAPKASS
jgi:Domain of unknown function (DUF5666)